jgi:hypothetical protein
MREPERTPAGEAMTPLILDLLRLNSLIVTSGDRLVAGLGLTSARWQVLGAIDAAGRPQPVHRDGLLAFEPNPHHRRAQLVVMTPKGRETFAAAMTLQVPWVNHLTDGLTVDEIGALRRVVAGLRERLEQAQESEA